MALFDVFEEISKKDILKTATGDSRIFGVMIGIVVDNYKDSMPGRVCVEIPVRGNEKKASDDQGNEEPDKRNILKWARVAMLSSGLRWGHYFLPEIGDQVLVAFENGNIEKPYVIGCIPKSANSDSKFIKGAVKDDNSLKKIVTRYGNTIEFVDLQKEDDAGGGNGGGNNGQGGNEEPKEPAKAKTEPENDYNKINIYTANRRHRIELNNEKQTIRIGDCVKPNSPDAGDSSQNQIFMKTEKDNGEILIQSAKTLKILVGKDKNTIEMTFNGEQGSVTLKAPKGITFETSDGSINLTSGGSNNIQMKSNNIHAEATQSLKLESSSSATLSGQTIKLG